MMIIIITLKKQIIYNEAQLGLYYTYVFIIILKIHM